MRHPSPCHSPADNSMDPIKKELPFVEALFFNYRLNDNRAAPCYHDPVITKGVSRVKETKLVSPAKMSKKARRELYAARRGSWDGVVPVTRVIPNKKKDAKSARKATQYEND